jgi:hypothetical protein
MTISKAERTLIAPLQRAILARQRHAACKPTPVNRALANALRRARFLDWVVTGGPAPPPASVLAEFAPHELARMNLSPHRAAPEKQRLWAGLRFRDEEYRGDKGAGDVLAGLVPRFGGALAAAKARRRPVMGSIRGWSADGEKALWIPAAQVAEIVQGGQLFGDKDYMQALEPEQGIFLRTGEDVFEIREALKKGLGGYLICRVWPSVPKSSETTGKKDGADAEATDKGKDHDVFDG